MSLPRLGAALPLLALAFGCGSEEPPPPSGYTDVGAGAGRGGSAGTGSVPTGGRAGTGGLTGGTAGGAGNPIGCPEAAPRPQAKIIVTQQTAKEETFASTSAFFPLVTVVIPGRTCVQRVEDACQVEICTQPATVFLPCEDERRTPIDAGPLTVAGGASSRTIAFSSDGAEPGYQGGFGPPLFLGGEKVTVTGAGATVPAFTAGLRAPVVVSFPTLSEKMPIQRKAGLTFSWTGNAVAPVVAAFSKYEQADGAETAKTFLVACTFPGSAPTAKIPPSALADLPAGPLSFEVIQADITTVAAGKWDVSIGVFANTIAYGAVLED